MTKQHRKTLKFYIRFVIRDILTTQELLKIQKSIYEEIQERSE